MTEKEDVLVGRAFCPSFSNRQAGSLSHQSVSEARALSREYPQFPLVGVGAIIVQNNRVVLVRRGGQPSKGDWSIPGGLVNVGETLKDASVREALEETSLEVEPIQLVELLERIFRDDSGRVQYHYVLADFLCGVRGGKLAPGSDALDAKWFHRDELQQLNLADITLQVILKGLDLNHHE